jgi:iron(II)-dependent oxidoreductase
MDGVRHNGWMVGATKSSSSLDRASLLDWYRRNRARSAALFGMLTDETYYSKPIDLRHPIVFYEGHLPAFSFNTLVKRGLGAPSIDARLETLFARGIDPHESAATNDDPEAARALWPSRKSVKEFADEADRQVMQALATGDIDQPGHPLLHDAEAAYCILEHEAMHQETLLYMWHRVPLDQKHRPKDYRPTTGNALPTNNWIEIPEGRARLGVDRGSIPFSWDNERQAHDVLVPAFSIQQHNVTNADYLEFVEAGGAQPLFWERADDGTWLWRGMFDRVPLPLAWPVYVSQADAVAYAKWRGSRLMSEAEFHRAAYGEPGGGERQHPWGNEGPAPSHGVFDFEGWDPQPAGTHPRGASAWGVHDLVGNGWEWTGTLFAPFEGFAPMPSYPEYSADFFDGEHFVMKGASPATARELIRPSFRNWFRAHYPYVYGSFRCVRHMS